MFIVAHRLEGIRFSNSFAGQHELVILSGIATATEKLKIANVILVAIEANARRPFDLAVRPNRYLNIEFKLTASATIGTLVAKEPLQDRSPSRGPFSLTEAHSR